jgi:predicted glycogen debranching enzyme
MKEFLLKQEDFNSIEKEWLVTNGIGGFACGTILGIPTRKYHSLLNASLPAPFGRTVMLNYVLEEIIGGENDFALTSVRLKDQEFKNPDWLIEFRLENGIPFWKYEKNGLIIEKSLFFINKQNTVCFFYKLLSNQTNIFLKWRPYFHFRMNEQAVNAVIENENYLVNNMGIKYEIECPHFPKLRLRDDSNSLYYSDYHEINNVFYEVEYLRGYESTGDLKSPGFFSTPLKPHSKVSFSLSTEEWPIFEALSANEAFKYEKFRKKNLIKAAGENGKNSIKSKLAIAADQFLITPSHRTKDIIKLQSAGEELRSIIAGFPWFTDWGRDTMISLEGLTLCTGRFKDAHAILYTFSHYIKNGLIPNMFPDGTDEGIYNTADASLWFFHAIDRYIELSGDAVILDDLLPGLEEIIHHHVNGTFFGIHIDNNDNLLKQGSKNFALTWMDAKMGNWIVTPRRGKTVEINALWYNALRLFENWTNTKLPISDHCYQSFNEKFWYEDGKYLYDVIDGEELKKDSSLRPNQLFSISLRYPILEQGKWKHVLNAVEKELLTPYGLRTLAPSDPHYCPYYHGNLTARDGAYHQGTVWPWLIGPFIDAWLKVNPENPKEAMKFLEGLLNQLSKGCIGNLAEIHDANDPYHARGCFAQAWSIAEVLRTFTKLNNYS